MEKDSAQIYYRADPDVPITYWENMSLTDKTEFIKLRDSFHQNQKASVKDRRLVSFSNEMQMVLNFTEKNETYRENKCILIGIAFAGPFICVNTRQLKTFLGRCKSSINGSFQQLGYVALRTKSKARNCVLSVLPNLANESNLLRQWSVRCASDDAKFCYISKFVPSQLPQITPEDLFDERKQQQMQQKPLSIPTRSLSSTTSLQSLAQQQGIKLPSAMHNSASQSTSANNATKLARAPSAPVKPQTQTYKPHFGHFNFDLPTFSELGLGDFNQKMPEMTPSFSVGCFSALDNDIDFMEHSNIEIWDPKWTDVSSFPRSKSAFFEGMEDISSIL